MLSIEYIALIATVITDRLFGRKSIQVCVFFVCTRREKGGSFCNAGNSRGRCPGVRNGHRCESDDSLTQTFPCKSVFLVD